MYDYNNKPELNITPLVDVMLVLLAILMVTAPVIEYEEKINLPKGSHSSKVSQSKKIDILLTKDGKILVNKSEIKLINFADSFVLFSKDKSRDIPVHIRADKNLKYDNVIFILKTIKETGFLKVALITDG
ncbi:MAG: biopolymer transporter ExbD [Campylobacteraceae bacterium]|jgi:biopolymer transport protein ExbD|nr:biopolymer transporter ExbD [Campylobacteraceae bacterium]MBT3882371.1 biopolymer transporter ExbD [Campylobacteraceae bacterium]MBT4031255.1 biopolymer transporter ExbD [Campylobacteraceae bacterium]MBT4178906.1 biopolymer transporter ExbD [Campylobacteraceae bacterium]MBT4573168.1 biopolymer transporter ExbD [Campylobacteraceae bacterium]